MRKITKWRLFFSIASVMLLFTAFFTFHSAYGEEIMAIPVKDLFGPNEWIEIDLQVDDYVRGSIVWIATKPDGSTEEGELSNIRTKKIHHTISRTAFDNQFGTWQIEYHYNEVKKTITVEVEPLIFKVTTDKQLYESGDIGTATITTDFFESHAAKAQSYQIEILNNNERAKRTDIVYLKAYQETTDYQFIIDELGDYNPAGTYKLVIQYYNVIVEYPFSIIDATSTTSIFLGTDKSSYSPGEIVEINIVVQDLIDNNAKLTVTNPFGKKITQTFPIESSLTKVMLDDIPIDIPGIYTYEVEFAGTHEINTFLVIEDGSPKIKSSLEISLTLDKKNFRPGESISASFNTDKIVSGQITYWFEDPQGKEGTQFTNQDVASGFYVINYVLPKDDIEGAWKMHVMYGDTQTYAIFFVGGKPIEGSIVKDSKPGYAGPDVLVTISDSEISLNNIVAIATDSQQNLYAVDAASSRIKIFEVDGNFIKSFGSYGSEPGQLKDPSGIFVDSNFIYVTDKENSRIQIFDKDGNFQTQLGNSGIMSQSLRNPEDIYVDSSGIYVADSTLDKISKYDYEGNYAGHIESINTASAKFGSSNSVVLNDDNVFILVKNSNRILQFHSDGIFVKSFGITGEDKGKFNSPVDLAIDLDGNIFVADAGNKRVQVFNQDGKFTKEWGSYGTGLGQFSEMTGIATDLAGNVWVSETSRIQKFSLGEETLHIISIPDWVRNNAEWWSQGLIEDEDFLGGIEHMIKQEIISIPNLPKSTSSTTEKIPDWIRNNAEWWSNGQIDDESFVRGIQYLVERGIILV